MFDDFFTFYIRCLVLVMSQCESEFKAYLYVVESEISSKKVRLALSNTISSVQNIPLFFCFKFNAILYYSHHFSSFPWFKRFTFDEFCLVGAFSPPQQKLRKSQMNGENIRLFKYFEVNSMDLIY